MFDKNADDDSFEVHGFLLIKYSGPTCITIEVALKNNRMDGFIPANMLLFALDRGGDEYHCNVEMEEIYYMRKLQMVKRRNAKSKPVYEIYTDSPLSKRTGMNTTQPLRGGSGFSAP